MSAIRWTQDEYDAHRRRVAKGPPHAAGPPPAPRKYRSHPTEVIFAAPEIVNGQLKSSHVFDSRKEATRYQDLATLRRTGLITALRLQEPFPLLVSGLLGVELVTIGHWYADFVYQEGPRLVVEDVKSSATRKNQEYQLKRKIVEANHGFVIREV